MVKRITINPVPSGSVYIDGQHETFGFMAHKIQFHYRSGTNPIKFSFNGSDDHVILDNDGTYPQSHELLEDHVEFWYSGGSGDEIVVVTAVS